MSLSVNSVWGRVLHVLLARDDIYGADVLACRATCRDAADEADPNLSHVQRLILTLFRPAMDGVASDWGGLISNWVVLGLPRSTEEHVVLVRRTCKDPAGETQWSLDTQQTRRDEVETRRWLHTLFATGYRVCGFGHAYDRRHLFHQAGLTGLAYPMNMWLPPQGSGDPWYVIRRDGCKCYACI
jgi:hypothetical protein